MSYLKDWVVFATIRAASITFSKHHTERQAPREQDCFLKFESPSGASFDDLLRAFPKAGIGSLTVPLSISCETFCARILQNFLALRPLAH